MLSIAEQIDRTYWIFIHSYPRCKTLKKHTKTFCKYFTLQVF